MKLNKQTQNYIADVLETYEEETLADPKYGDYLYVMAVLGDMPDALEPETPADEADLDNADEADVCQYTRDLAFKLWLGLRHHIAPSA